MTYYAYVIYDRIAGLYGAPFFSLNRGTGVRDFRHRIAQNLMAEPSDFELYEIGSYDTSSAKFLAFDEKIFVEKGQVISNG